MTRRPSTEQQLTYSEERLTDVISFKDSLTTKDGIIISDVARAFKGDHPATNMNLDSRKVVTMLAMPVTLIQTAIKNTVTLSNANTCPQRLNHKSFAYSFIPKPIKRT